MNKIVNFKDLVIAVEATTPPAAPLPPPVNSVQPPKLSTVKAAANVIGRGVKGLGKEILLNPKGLGARLAGSDGYDVLKGAYEGGKAFKKAISAEKEAQLKKYYLTLSMPNGWPRKGSNFSIITMYNGEYKGVVVNVSKLDEKNAAYTIIAEPLDTTKPRLAFVATIDEGSLPFYAIKQIMVSNITPEGKYIKNEKESGHQPKLEFDAESSQYILDYKNRPAKEYIEIDPSIPEVHWYKRGEIITGRGIISDEIVSGSVINYIKKGSKAFNKVAAIESVYVIKVRR